MPCPARNRMHLHPARKASVKNQTEIFLKQGLLPVRVIRNFVQPESLLMKTILIAFGKAPGI